MPTEHATFGSSTAKRTNNCPAWVELSQGIPNRESQAARDGTITHSIIEEWLLADPADGMQVTVEGAEADHIELASDLMDAIEATMAKYSITEYEPEVRATVAEDIFGTIDFVALTADNILILGDVKSGRGFQVEAENNDQILFAAWAMRHISNCYDLVEKADALQGIIWQPGRDGGIQTKEWAFTWGDVATWGENHIEQIAKARKGGQTPNPGDHCAFCPAAFKCPAKTGDALRALQYKPEDLATAAEAMNMVDDLKAWCRDVEQVVYNALEVGQSVPGWKLVPKRASRKWIDEAIAIKALRRPLGGLKTITTTKLLGIGAIEKLLKAKKVEFDLDAITVKESSGSTLAPESDSRAAVLPSEALSAALNSIKL
jgi:hypothetical protein